MWLLKLGPLNLWGPNYDPVVFFAPKLLKSHLEAQSEFLVIFRALNPLFYEITMLQN